MDALRTWARRSCIIAMVAEGMARVLPYIGFRLTARPGGTCSMHACVAVLVLAPITGRRTH